MKRISTMLLFVIVILSANKVVFAQAQLVKNFVGEGTNNYFGCSVSSAGDVNKDGYDDVIVGAYNNKSAYIYFGGSSMGDTPDVTITDETFSFFGWSVSSAGDVNKDGYDDVIIGETGYGVVYIYFGGSSMNSNYNTTDADVTIIGANEGYNFGCSVSSAGDVNGDTYDDVIIGESDNNLVYIYFGGSSMDVTADVTMTGSDHFGFSVSGAGNVNGDTYDDVIVGNWMYPGYGEAYIYLGGSSMDNTADITLTGDVYEGYFGYSVSGAGDVNGDTYDDVIVGEYVAQKALIFYGGSSMDVTADVILTGELGNTYFGNSVSGAGDVNGDTYDDVIVGSSRYNNTYTGRTYIFYGGSSMNNTADVTMTGENEGDYFGWSVSGAGDVNGDTYDDVIIGAEYYNSSTGKSYIYSDPAAPMPVELTSFTAKVLQGTVSLNWQTATEVNNYGFNVECKTNNAGWNTIGFVDGSGNSNSPKEYSFVDENPLSGTVYYRLKQIDNDGSFEYSPIVEINSQAPDNFELNQNYPNPFNPTTTISYSIPRDQQVTLKVYNILGKEVMNLVNKQQPAGSYAVMFEGKSLNSGIYFYTLQAEGFRETYKMILLK